MRIEEILDVGSGQNTYDDNWKVVMGTHLWAIRWEAPRGSWAGGRVNPKGSMWVSFVGGGVYVYENIPYNLFHYLWKLPSPRRGSYFHYNIRTNFSRHPHKKVED